VLFYQRYVIQYNIEKKKLLYSDKTIFVFCR